jgi:putative PIN family toxin of toxin-antitoxin system
MIRAVLDTNVFVSALNFGGTPNAVLKLLEADSFTLCISQSIIDETRRILLLRFEWSEEDLAHALDPLLTLAEIVEPTTQVSMSRDRNDDHILACALDASADVIVTGDDDLLSLGRYENIRIVTPREFVTMLELA